jgi:hypothetical protein
MRHPLTSKELHNSRDQELINSFRMTRDSLIIISTTTNTTCSVWSINPGTDAFKSESVEAALEMSASLGKPEEDFGTGTEHR